MSESRLDDELNVAAIEFSSPPKWLQDLNTDPCGFPKKTPFGTLWRGVDTSAIDEHGQTEFIRAVIDGRLNIHYAEMLAEFQDTDVNIQDNQGRTALHWASAASLTIMVRLCLSVPECNIGLKDNDGLTAFDVARESGDDKIPDLFYRSMVEMEDTDPQVALLRVLTVTSDPNAAKDRPIFPGKAMFDPVEDRNSPLVRALINRGVDLTATNKHGDTALHVAAAGVDNLDILTQLLEAGSDVNAVGRRGATPLHYATQAADKRIVQALLRWKAKANAKDHDGKTALVLAKENKNGDLVLLLEDAMDQDGQTGQKDEFVVVPEETRDQDEEMGQEDNLVGLYEEEIAQEQIRTEVVTVQKRQVLMGVPLAEIESRSATGLTPLLQAAMDGDLETLQELLHHRADRESRVENIYTLFPSDELLSTSAQIEARNNWDYNALHLASKYGHAEIVTALLDDGASVMSHGGKYYQTDYSTGRAATALHLAAEYGHPAIVKILQAKGARTEATNYDGLTALDLAAKNGHTAIVKNLLTEIMPGHVTSSALHRAAENGYTTTVETLLDGGALIWSSDPMDRTALHLAAVNGHTETVVRLLNRGAQFASKKQYAEALRIATRNQHKEVYEILREHKPQTTTSGSFGSKMLGRLGLKDKN